MEMQAPEPATAWVPVAALRPEELARAPEPELRLAALASAREPVLPGRPSVLAWAAQAAWAQPVQARALASLLAERALPFQKKRSSSGFCQSHQPCPLSSGSQDR